MKVIVELPDYDPNHGIQYNWERGFTIAVSAEGKEIFLDANKAGLVSLANHLLFLAQNSVPFGSHMHLDDSNSLESGSSILTITKKDL